VLSQGGVIIGAMRTQRACWLALAGCLAVCCLLTAAQLGLVRAKYLSVIISSREYAVTFVRNGTGLLAFDSTGPAGMELGDGVGVPSFPPRTREFELLGFEYASGNRFRGETGWGVLVSHKTATVFFVLLFLLVVWRLRQRRKATAAAAVPAGR
jgi:hypothetical protein